MTRNKKNINENIKSIFLLFLFLIFASLIGYFFKVLGFSETNIVIVYILFVLLISRLTYGYIYGIISSIISTFIYNYFFTAPHYTFDVYDSSYIITFIIMTITSIITSALTSRIKENAIEADRREVETKTLYKLTNKLIEADEINDITNISLEAICEVISYKIGCLWFDEEGSSNKVFIQKINNDKQIYRKVNNIIEIKNNVENLKENYYLGEEFCDWPIYGRESILGILRVPKEISFNLSKSQAKLLLTMLDSIALSVERLKESRARIKSNEEMIQERYRSNLLRAISHDLRTPLSGIMGTTEILMDMTEANQEVFQLVLGIYKDADWLHSLVENILSLTKLQEGRLVLNKEFEVLDEIIGSAINHFSRRASKFEILVNVPDEIILIPVDAKLIIQVLINLLDNAMKHSHTSNKITISARLLNDYKKIEIAVIDNGSGISKKDLPNIFKMFYTSNNGITDGQHGIGLGLNICQAIISAHGGDIIAENREDTNGAIFKFTLPMEE